MNNNYKRVKYKKSPLVEVVFQIRFPTILSINANQPVEFQDRIRDKFPYYQEKLEESADLLINTNTNALSMQKTSKNKNYEFISEDGTTKVNLTSSFVAISTRNYTQWEDFISKIMYVVPIFESLYNPSFYTRIGLRYIDVISRSRLNLNEKKWVDLIESHILGLIAKEQENGIKTYVSEVEYETGQQDIISKAHFELVQVNDESELSLLIDTDYYVLGTTKKEEMCDRTHSLHTASSLFLQSAIKEELHLAMEPEEIKK